MPFYGAGTLIGAIALLIRAAFRKTAVKINPNALTMRVDNLPFLRSVSRVNPIESANFVELFTPLPVGCRLYLRGNAETEWFWRVRPFKRSTARSMQILVPHFANATPSEFEELLGQYLDGANRH